MKTVLLLPAFIIAATVPVSLPDSTGEISTYQNGAVITADGKIQLSKLVSNQLSFAHHNYSPLFIGNKGWFYVNKSGDLVFTVTYDNGPDEFHSGLARTKVDGKYGYIDSNLTIKIAPQFDAAFPFSDSGIAKVGNNCTLESDGEHSRWQCEEFFLIDTSGKIVTDHFFE